MIIRLQCDPLTPAMSWEKFIAEKKPYSIALDGYVCDGPKYKLDGPWLNFNHQKSPLKNTFENKFVVLCFHEQMLQQQKI